MNQKERWLLILFLRKKNTNPTGSHSHPLEASKVVVLLSKRTFF